MSQRRPTDLELAAALRAHVPAAPADLQGLIAAAIDNTSQQRAWPSVLGALTDADPVARRRGLLLAAAALLAVALAGAAAAGALQIWRSQQLPAGAVGLFAFVRDGDLYVARPDGTEAALVAHVDGSALSRPSWSADGRWLAVQTEEPAILGLDLTTGELRRLAAGTIGAWSPVVSTLAYFPPTGEIALLDVADGANRVLVPRPVGTEGYPGYQGAYDNEALVWSPDGRWLLTEAADPEGEPPRLVRIDAASGAMTTVASEDGFFQFRTTWAWDASRVAYSRRFERGQKAEGFRIANADGSGSVEISDPNGGAADPVWSPSGDWIAYRSVDRAHRPDDLVVVRADGSDRRRLAEDIGGIIGWSPEGTAIAYTTCRICGWKEVPAGQDEEVVGLHIVLVADGSDRSLPVPADAISFDWARPNGEETLHTVPGLPSPIATGAPDLPLALPPAADPVQPDATWGGLAFRIQKGEGDCYVAMLRFPDALTVLSPSEPPPTELPPASPPAPGASPGPQPAAESCEFTFAPDGSAFVRASQAYASFEVIRSDGTRLSGPMPHDVPVWSPGSTWLAGADWMMRPDGSERRELPGPPSWSPNDQVLAVQGDDGVLLVGRGDGTELRPIGSFPMPMGWAPDGSVFAFVRDGDAWLALADGSQARNLTRFPLGGVTGAWWSPDGRWIAILQGTTMWAFSPDGSIRRRLGSGLGPTA